MSAALMALATLPDFIAQYPPSENLTIFGDSKFLTHAATVLGHIVQVIIRPTSEEHDDDAVIGANVKNLRRLKKLGMTISPYDEEKAIYGFELTFKIILNQSIKVDFEVAEITGPFENDSHAAVIVVALALAYTGKPYDTDSIILSATKECQKHGIPGLIYHDAVRVSISALVPTYDAFGRNVVSPFPPRSVAPSPVPYLDAIKIGLPSPKIQPAQPAQAAESTLPAESASILSQVSKNDGYTKVSYQKDRKPGMGKICKFDEYFANGVAKGLTDGTIVSAYSKFVAENHQVFKGATVKDDKGSFIDVELYRGFREEMKKRLGDFNRDVIRAEGEAQVTTTVNYFTEFEKIYPLP